MRSISVLATTTLTALFVVTARAGAETGRPGFEAIVGAAAGAELLSQSSDPLGLIDCFCPNDRMTAIGPSVAGRLGLSMGDSFRISEDLGYARLYGSDSPAHQGLEVETLELLVAPEYVDESGARAGLALGFTYFWAQGLDPNTGASLVDDSGYYRLLARGGYDWKVGPRWSLGAEVALGFAASTFHYNGAAFDGVVGMAVAWK